METAEQELSHHSIFGPDDQVEVITFYVDATQYATPVSEVRYIEQDKRKTTRIEVNAQLGAEVTTYQGKPVPIYDLANLMGCEAEYTTNLGLLQVLDDGEKEQIDWLGSLESSLRTDSPFTGVRDPMQSEFGKWYSDFKAEDELLRDIMADFETPRQKLYALADELLALRDSDNVEKAISTLEYERGRTLNKLASLFASAKERLENITRPILLYIDTSKKLIAVRLNAISDIVTYHKSTFTPQHDVDDNEDVKELSFISGYLENKDHEPPCVLLDWRMFSVSNRKVS